MPCPTLQQRTFARAGGSARHQLWTHAAETLLICGDGGCAGKGKGEGKGDGEGEGEDESRGGWMKGEGEQERARVSLRVRGLAASTAMWGLGEGEVTRVTVRGGRK